MNLLVYYLGKLDGVSLLLITTEKEINIPGVELEAENDEFMSVISHMAMAARSYL